MDYEKKYKDALADMKVIYPKLKGYAKRAVEHIFPELKESEDERIINQLISLVRSTGEVVPIPANQEELIAYLEKQKDEAQRQFNLGVQAGREEVMYELEKEQKPAESISQLSVKGKGVYKICPHCKERMIRDDSKVYTSIPPQYGYNCPKCGAIEFDTVVYDNPEIEEQKPTEWSKEDEKMLRNVYESLYAYKCDIRAGIMDKNSRELLDDVEKEKQWLKSLRPSWKPSEEQRHIEGQDTCYLNKQKLVNFIEDCIAENLENTTDANHDNHEGYHQACWDIIYRINQMCK